MPPMRVAVIDVGSNTARLLVADVGMARRVDAVVERRERLGLGAEIAAAGALSGATVRVVARICRRYAKIARAHDVDRAWTIVTAPGRQGRSSGALVRALAAATGLEVSVLSAADEGRLAYDGALARAPAPAARRVGVVDVGGGSTEIVVGDVEGGARWVSSIDLGSIRLTSRYLRRDPPRAGQLRKARDAVSHATAALAPPKPDVAFATGGSARAAAKLVGDTSSAADLERAIDMLATRASAKVARSAGIHPVRAASLLGGLLLLAEASRTLGRPLVRADGGVREGAALALARLEVTAAA
jgi:exopolyphosphatase/guanosine-5'-triphosphate,3'-diphosphate pyrophosphatase